MHAGCQAEALLSSCRRPSFKAATLSCLHPLKKLHLLKMGGLATAWRTLGMAPAADRTNATPPVTVLAEPAANAALRAICATAWATTWVEPLRALKAAQPGCYIVTADD